MTDPSGRTYYQNPQTQTTQWEAPGCNTVFGSLVAIASDGSGSCTVDVGTGVPEQHPSASVGVLDPAFRGWGNSIRVRRRFGSGSWCGFGCGLGCAVALRFADTACAPCHSEMPQTGKR